MLAGNDEAGCGVGILSYMNIELALLAASVVLGIVHIIIVSHLQSWQRGYWWTASSRERSVAPLTGIAGRAERALRNYLETFPFFAAAILVVTVTNTHSWLTVWGAHFYFWGRIVYAILYTAELPLARSLVWNIPTIGILMNVAGLFLKCRSPVSRGSRSIRPQFVQEFPLERNDQPRAARH